MSELPGTEHTDHVSSLMDAAHADVEARMAHGREAVQGGPHPGAYASYPAPMPEQPPPSGSGVDTDPFADPGNDAEEPGESAAEEYAEEQSRE